MSYLNVTNAPGNNNSGAQTLQSPQNLNVSSSAAKINSRAQSCFSNCSWIASLTLGVTAAALALPGLGIGCGIALGAGTCAISKFFISKICSSDKDAYKAANLTTPTGMGSPTNTSTSSNMQPKPLVSLPQKALSSSLAAASTSSTFTFSSNSFASARAASIAATLPRSSASSLVLSLPSLNTAHSYQAQNVTVSTANLYNSSLLPFDLEYNTFDEGIHKIVKKCPSADEGFRIICSQKGFDATKSGRYVWTVVLKHKFESSLQLQQLLLQASESDLRQYAKNDWDAISALKDIRNDYISSAPASAVSVSTTAKKCLIPGCSKSVYIDSVSGKIHDFCGRTHAQEWNKMQPRVFNSSSSSISASANAVSIRTIAKKCLIPGCSKSVYIDPVSGRIHDFCGRTHAQEWNKMQS